MKEQTLEQRMERIEAVNEIENLMGRYAFYHAAFMHKECLEISAVNTPGVRAELPFGIYEGKQGLERLYINMLGKQDQDVAARIGKLHQNTMTTSVIEVAGDLKTAKGVWMCPGHATDTYGKNGELQAKWRWVKYGADFTKEDGKWKIWHIRVYGIFATSYYQSWVENQAGAPPAPPKMPPEIAPDRPAHKLWQYSVEAVYPNDPAPPEPFTTFDESTAY